MTARSPAARRLVLAALSAVALAIGGPALAAQAPAAPGAPNLATYPQRSYPGGVAKLADVRYGVSMGFRPVTLDLYLQPEKMAPKPAVVFFHGGGWFTGDATTGAMPFPDWSVELARLAARGYVVASVNYRLSGEARFPAAEFDAKAAVRWLRANAAQLGIDPARIAAWGGSAGGHLASLLGTSCGVAALEGPAAPGAPSSCVQAVVDWYGPVEFSQMDAQALPGSMSHADAASPESRFLGCPLPTCARETIALASPLTHIDPKDPPFLIFHGDADLSVAPKQSQMLDEALKKAGVRSRFVMVPGSKHTFEGVSPEKGQEILKETFAFFDETVGKR